MKIVHMCLGCFFPDNHSYQENMLPKFHKELGYDVEVIASLFTFDKNGKDAYLDSGSIYQNEYDIKVTRLDYRKPNKLQHKLKQYIGTYKALEEAKPDMLFIHGCQFLDIFEVVKYLNKHPNVKTFVDNHVDFSNSATNWLSKNILHKIIWKRCARLIEPYATKFYGVLPARVDFLVNMYGIQKQKVELLVMGADDQKVIEAIKTGARDKIRNRYDIEADDFLIMTGGKIDAHKTQTLLLMEAVRKIYNPKVKLIVFGSVTQELKDKVNELCIENKVTYIGWVQSAESYEYFAASDLVVFPGRHSVFWEQVVGQGIPMVVKHWDGTTHIDLGGNVKFLNKDSVEEIQQVLEEIIDNPVLYAQMKSVAQERGMKMFSYKEISSRAVDRV